MLVQALLRIFILISKLCKLIIIIIISTNLCFWRIFQWQTRTRDLAIYLFYLFDSKFRIISAGWHHTSEVITIWKKSCIMRICDDPSWWLCWINSEMFYSRVSMKTPLHYISTAVDVLNTINLTSNIDKLSWTQHGRTPKLGPSYRKDSIIYYSFQHVSICPFLIVKQLTGF